ncbi:MAG: NAD-dependent DNA ligase LigA [Deltaproteobacteria bacterium]|nr:NAD-dependent DNA ligase LigA [Deltaproteobacteria bacterium]
MSEPTTRPDPAEELARLIRHHRELYYAGEPEISDAEFDALEDQLRALRPDHQVLAEVGAPPASSEAPAPAIRRVEATYPAEVTAKAGKLVSTSHAYYAGDFRVADTDYKALFLELEAAAPDHPALEAVVPPMGREWKKAQHELPMGSLNKVNSEEELLAWVERCDELAKTAGATPLGGDLVITEKLDGLSVELVYEGGLLEAGITRGDGAIGERITPNVAVMRGVPQRIPHQARLSVRGEILLSKDGGEELAAHKREVDRRFTGLTSLRNAASGQARAKEPRLLPACRYLQVLAYDVEGIDSELEREKLDHLRALGFATPPAVFGDRSVVVETYRAYASGKRSALGYEIDGLVIRSNSMRTAALLGELNNRPRAAVALKFENEMKVSTLREIRWETGPTGRITPVALIDPVLLAGATVVRASLHNLARVTELGIGVGDQVLVSRRNDVIPYVEKVEVKGPEVARAPSSCARCGVAISRDGEYIVCRNDQCPAKRIGRLSIWVRQLDLLAFGEKTLERLFEEGLAREPADLYRLTRDKISSLDGFGDISAKKLLEQLEATKQVPLPQLIAALGIESVSLETGKLLLKAGLDTFEKIASASAEQLARIPGLGEIKAERIVEGIKSRREEVDRLRAVGVVPVAPREGGPLFGLSFCFSGAHSRPRKVLHGIVEKNGGQIANDVTKGLSYLVLADATSNSSKAQKARKLGTEVIDEEGFLAIVTGKGGSSAGAG